MAELENNTKITIKQLIVFKASNQEFGVHIDAVQEIIKMGYITPIPEAPKFIKGLINVRGDIVPTIDLRAYFHLPEENDLPKHIILTRQEGNLFGLIVEEVSEVLRIDINAIQPPPKLIENIQRKFVIGVMTYNERLIILLDLSKILAETELMKFYQNLEPKNDKTKTKKMKINHME